MYHVLYVDRRRHLYEIECDSISQAYHYYLRHFSTFGDWFYYLKTAHTFLHKVTDERVMLAIFRNVFDDRQFLVSFKKPLDKCGNL